jgi:hypothetical protein
MTQVMDIIKYFSSMEEDQVPLISRDNNKLQINQVSERGVIDKKNVLMNALTEFKKLFGRMKKDVDKIMVAWDDLCAIACSVRIDLSIMYKVKELKIKTLEQTKLIKEEKLRNRLAGVGSEQGRQDLKNVFDNSIQPSTNIIQKSTMTTTDWIRQQIQMNAQRQQQAEQQQSQQQQQSFNSFLNQYNSPPVQHFPVVNNINPSAPSPIPIQQHQQHQQQQPATSSQMANPISPLSPYFQQQQVHSPIPQQVEQLISNPESSPSIPTPNQIGAVERHINQWKQERDNIMVENASRWQQSGADIYLANTELALQDPYVARLQELTSKISTAEVKVAGMKAVLAHAWQQQHQQMQQQYPSSPNGSIASGASVSSSVLRAVQNLGVQQAEAKDDMLE